MTGQVHRRSARVMVAVLVAFLAGATLVATGPAAQAAFPGLDGLIAFQSNRDGHDEIYVMKADGTGQTRLTNNNQGNAQPSWSADGSKIVFSSNRDGNAEIYVMNANGSGVAQATHGPEAHHASWGTHA
jgi:Tol biopolymer transport system component